MSKSNPKQEIFLAARKLFSHKGYHGTTIRDIAEARGILSGSLYAHISSKEDLLFYIVDEGADAFLQALTPVVLGEGTAVEKLERGLAEHIRVVTKQKDAAKVFLQEWTALGDERRALIQKKRDAYEQLWIRVLEDGASEGVFSADDLKYLRLLILSAGNWVYEWYNENGDLSPEEIAKRFSSIILHGALKKR
ncbi:TetR/AcrR family transcriptional regulator [Sulfoacidibacillus thermotolerans]|uniref:TetR family transcriptional regulator n=1 Tax=Sulfoacidibacillus thermotolerans TaxID=1765684 RepID=A0A2U3D763_SULT2|nr:TetR/AcrR family transcriptional regulator [Sulfoacidibacillus thermotolerans]PWI57122.1 TetR family transcriptional regulator [Sulfoacidibacillus thermotolerans]